VKVCQSTRKQKMFVGPHYVFILTLENCELTVCEVAEKV